MKKIFSLLLLLLMGMNSALAQSVIIGGTEITEGVHDMYGGTIIYYPGILTMKDVTIDDKLCLDGNIAIVVEGHCTVNNAKFEREDTNNDGILIKDESNVYIVPGSSNDILEINSLHGYAIRVGKECKFGIGDKERIVTMNIDGFKGGIFCDYVDSELYITNANVNIKRNTYDLIYAFAKLELNNCFMMPGPKMIVTQKRDGFMDYDLYCVTSEKSDMHIRPTKETYDLKVLGVTVNDANAKDITGNGRYSYDASTKTLALQLSAYMIDSKEPLIDSDIQGLNVKVSAKGAVLRSSSPLGTIHSTGDIFLSSMEDNTEITIANKAGSAIVNEGCQICIGEDEHSFKLTLDAGASGIKGITTSERKAGLAVRNTTLNILESFEGAIVGQASADLSNETVTFPYRGLMKDGALVDRNLEVYMKDVTMMPGKQYPIWYNGYPVTEFNADKLDTFSKSVTYDSDSKTLNINGLSLYANREEYPLIDSDVDGLRIVFKYYNKLGSICPEGVIRSTGNFSIEPEEGSLCYIENTDGPAIVNEACTARIRGAGILTLDGTAGILGKCTKRGDAYLQLSSTRIEIGKTLKGAVVGQKDISMVGVAVKEPYYVYAKDGAIVGDNGKPYKDKIKLSPAETYNLWLADRQVNEFNEYDILHSSVSKAQYHPFEKRLVLRDVKVETNNRNVLRSAEEGLTIELSGKNNLTTTAEDGRGLYLQHHTSIVSPNNKSVTNITASQTGIETARGVSLSIGDGESDNMKLEITAGEYGILGTESRMGNPLSITKAAVSIASTSKAAVSGFSGISLSGVDILQEGATIKNGNVVDDMGELYSEKLDIGKVVKYGIFLAGVEVSELNKDDILGDGSARFDSDKNILTLKGTLRYDEGNVLEIARPIVLHGDGPVTLITGEGTAIMCTGTELLIEDMELTCSSGFETIYMEDEGLLRIDNSTVNLQSENYSAIDLASNELWLRSSTLNVSGNGKSATINDCGKLILEACEITSDNYFSPESGSFISNASGASETGDIIIAQNGEAPSAYLYVMGKPVTDFNASDIMYDGTMSYDEETKTLYLAGTRIETNSSEPVIDAMGDITISCTNTNTIGAYNASVIRNKYGTTTINAKSYVSDEIIVLASFTEDTPALDLYGKLNMDLGTMMVAGKNAAIDLHGEDMEITMSRDDMSGLLISVVDPTLAEEDRNPLVRNCGKLLLHECDIQMGTYFSRKDQTFHASDDKVQKSDILIKPSEIPDAITDIHVSQEQPHAIYDLQGRRISESKAKHGIYIIDGKKVVR